MRFPTMWYVRPAKPQISLRIRAVWSEPLLVAWVFYDCLATDWTSFGVSWLKRRLQRLVRVYACQNVNFFGSHMSRLNYLIFQLSTLEEDFIYAAEFGDIPTVQRILDENPHLNVDFSDILGRTPLRLAVGNEHLEVRGPTLLSSDTILKL